METNKNGVFTSPLVAFEIKNGRNFCRVLLGEQGGNWYMATEIYVSGTCYAAAPALSRNCFAVREMAEKSGISEIIEILAETHRR